MDFEAYLQSKKIDSKMFLAAEPAVWSAWKSEFEQMHPNSFTVQKLNLINPIRRKYPLPLQEEQSRKTETPEVPDASPVAKPVKPMIKPKPKFN